MADLSSLFQYYLDNQDELVKRYNGKYLIIFNNEVVSAFNSEDEAYMYAKDKYGLGNFLLQLCTKGPEAYSQHFRSRVVFA